MYNNVLKPQCVTLRCPRSWPRTPTWHVTGTPTATYREIVCSCTLTRFQFPCSFCTRSLTEAHKIHLPRNCTSYVPLPVRSCQLPQGTPQLSHGPLYPRLSREDRQPRDSRRLHRHLQKKLALLHSVSCASSYWRWVSIKSL
jgi:hypothetical protein